MKIYEKSCYEKKECSCFMARDDKERFLVVTGGTMLEEFRGEYLLIDGKKAKKCPLDVHNSRLVRDIFPFTKPVTARGRKFSIGLGDRLGIASAGHIKAVRGKGVFPVLAQQSIRELNLTGRTYDEVLADATWAVLQEGYEDGYGADGDHLKTKGEVSMALEAGFSMITLDCSEFIGGSELSHADARHMETYRDCTFDLPGGESINISDENYTETIAIYGRALEFAVDIYNELLKDRDDVDFELSIDETMTPTKPEAHFLIAAWLKEKGVNVLNIAPRFCGEFQKGIDYRGDLVQFEKELRLHQAVAEYFGHRLSIHSGSDKFSVFPIIGRLTGLDCHVKTAGTNWLEALRCIATADPALFRRMYRFALDNLDGAKAYYHIYTEKQMAPDDEALKDTELVRLLDINESRQILHITYGYLLKASNPFRKPFFITMHACESIYHEYLQSHINHHLSALTP